MRTLTVPEATLTDHPARTRPRFWGVVAAAAIAALLLVAITAAVTSRIATQGGEPPSASEPPATATSPDVEGLVSTASGQETLSPLPVTIEDDGASAEIVVDTTSRRQRIEGFGAAMTHSSAQLIHALPDGERAKLLDELFGADAALSLSVLRIPIGASDFTPVAAFTLDDVAEGETDWELDGFDLSPDQADLIPVLQEVVRINPDIRIIASAWSPPAWMKTPASLEGGRLTDDDRTYQAYADYLTRFVSEYRDEGIDIDYLTVQNEPQLRHPDGYPGTDLPVWQATKVIEHLGSTLASAGLDTGILGYDHNWSLNPSDAGTTPEGEDPAYDYPADLLRTSASRWITGTAFHCYYGDASRQSWLLSEFPTQQIWVTECSGSGTVDDSAEKVYFDTFSWQAGSLFLPALSNGASGVLTWNIALDEEHGPHTGGCDSCSGVVELDAEGVTARNAEYALLGQVSHFVPAGSVRVNAGGSDLPHVAFRTPDHRTVLLVWNGQDQARDLTFGDGSTVLRAELPPLSMATISWADSGD